MNNHASQLLLDSAREGMKYVKHREPVAPITLASVKAIGFGAAFARCLRQMDEAHRASALAFLADFVEAGEGSVSAMGYKSISGEK